MTQQLVELTKIPGGLEVTFLKGKSVGEDVAEILDRAKRYNFNDDQVFAELIEYQLCNGWQWINAEEVAPSSTWFISDEASRGDDNELEYDDGAKFYFDNLYETRLTAETLLKERRVVLFETEFEKESEA